MAFRIRLGRVQFDLPESIFFDTSFVVAVVNQRDRWYGTATALVRQLARLHEQEGLRLFTSVRVIDEGWWKWAMLLYEQDHGGGAWAALDREGRKRAFANYRQELSDMVQGMRDAGVEILGLPTESVDVALSLITDPVRNMEPADAFHVAVKREHEINAIATNDHDFADVAGLQRVNFNF